MRSPIRVTQHDAGPRLFIGPLRVHHFDFGLVALGLGAYLIARDRHDFLNWALQGRR